jgi:multicomponent K+:H+ antiporter subunit G
MLWEITVSALLLIGALFMLLGSIGLLRLPDFLSRLHAPTKATTLGVGSMLLASMVGFAALGQPSVHEVLIVLFLFLCAPVTAQLLAKAALHLAGERGLAREEMLQPTEESPLEGPSA